MIPPVVDALLEQLEADWRPVIERAVIAEMERRRRVAEMEATVRDLEARAQRVTGEPERRVYEMPDGRMLTIDGSPGYQVVVPLSREDAEDFYGWSAAL